MGPGPAQSKGAARWGSPAVGKTSSCTATLSTAGFGAPAPKGEGTRWGTDGPNQLLLHVAKEPHMPAAWAAGSCPSACISWLQLVVVFTSPGWRQLTTSWVLTRLVSQRLPKHMQHMLARPTLHRDTAPSHGRRTACFEQTCHLKTPEAE